MARAQIPLSLAPDRCDVCRRCVAACPHDALKVGPTYIYVDWQRCDGCLACAKTCATGAIEKRAAGGGVRPAGAAAGTGSKDAEVKPPVTPARSASTSKSTSAVSAAEPPAWTLGEAWVVLMALFGAFVLKDVVMASEFVRALDSDVAVFARVAAIFTFYALQAGVLALLAWRRDVPVLDALGFRAGSVSWRARLGSVGLVLGLLVATRLVALVYGMTAQWAGWDPPAREIADLTEVFGPTVWGLLASVALVVLVAPIVEEAVFRGVVQGAIAVRSGHRVAIVVAAAIFALSHVTPWLFAPLFVLGLACGWLAHTRASLLPAVWLHAAYNLLPVAVAFYLVW